MAEPLEVLARHVERFNDGVRSGDFGPMVDWFTEDGELVFAGGRFGPFQGREAILGAYRSQPPDDLMAVREATVTGNEVVAVYGWQREGYARAGEMRLELDGDRVRRLVVTIEPEPPAAG